MIKVKVSSGARPLPRTGDDAAGALRDDKRVTVGGAAHGRGQAAIVDTHRLRGQQTESKMLFEIDHRTSYRYSLPVQLDPHLLRFRPLERPGQHTTACEIAVDPTPSTRASSADAWGNQVERVAFQGETDHLEIRVRLCVMTSDPPAGSAPSDFALPAAGGNRDPALSAYLEPLDDAIALRDFAAPIMRAAAGSGLNFLDGLNSAVHSFYHRGVRIDGPPMRPSQTIVAGEGVCRDLTLLFMAVCRQAGLASRFVSGYQQGDGTRELRYLHAWPEIHLPDYGWLGFDPTHGGRVGADHVAVAAGPTAVSVTPVEGGYRFIGEVLNSTLKTEIRISTLRS